jgi:hypothetical protein
MCNWHLFDVRLFTDSQEMKRKKKLLLKGQGHNEEVVPVSTSFSLLTKSFLNESQNDQMSL